MTRRGSRCSMGNLLSMLVVAGLLMVSLPAGGCRHGRTPDTKQARLIAAENIQLKKRLADHEVELAQAVERCEERLAACQERAERLQKDLQKGVAARVNSVTAAVVDENAELRREIQQLRAEIEKLEAPRSQAP